MRRRSRAPDEWLERYLLAEPLRLTERKSSRVRLASRAATLLLATVVLLAEFLVGLFAAL